MGVPAQRTQPTEQESCASKFSSSRNWFSLFLISLSRLTRSLRASLLMSLTLIFATYSVALGAAVGTRNQYRQAFSAVMPGPAAAVVNLGPNHRLPQGDSGLRYEQSRAPHLDSTEERTAAS